MFDVNIALLLVVSLLVMVALGVHIAVALGMASILGLYIVKDGNIAVVQATVGSATYHALRDYIFAVIPLFMLMGEFIGKSGAVTDVYRGINRALRGIPGRLAIATVLGNSIFSFVTGVSIASAAAFSRIAYPEMKRYGYDKGFALGAVAGSSCLGMLIPPSVLMIVWGILTERSIGKIFFAGILPGFLLVCMFILYVLATSIFRPHLTGDGVSKPETDHELALERTNDVSLAAFLSSAFGIAMVVLSVLGGIWMGIFSPTEAAGVGALVGLALGVIKGMRFRDIINSILSVGRTSAPILLLLVSAALYSRTLAMTGVTSAIQGMVADTGFGPYMVLTIMVLIWFMLGMVIDSISIMLLTLTIFEPIAVNLGFDPIAFAIIGILAIEAGLLTPPFGLLVYTVQSAIQDEKDDITVTRIFASSMPYWLIILLAMIVIALVPEIATTLPNLMF